jgi:hypothetical protein
MVTVQEKAMYVFWFFETKSVIKMIRRHRTQYGKDPPSDNAIRRWLKQREGARRPSSSQEDDDRIQEAWTSYVLKLFSILQY